MSQGPDSIRRRQRWLPVRTDNTFGLGVSSGRLLLAVFPYNIVTESAGIGFVLRLRTGQIRRKLQGNSNGKRGYWVTQVMVNMILNSALGSTSLFCDLGQYHETRRYLHAL